MPAAPAGSAFWWLIAVGVVLAAWVVGVASPVSAAPWLSLSIWVPIAGGVLVLAVAGEDSRAPLARKLALAAAILGFLISVPLYAGFDTSAHGMQFTELHPWVERFHIQYALGVDGISLIFVLLNSFVTILVVIAGWEVITTRVSQYMAAFLIMSGLMNGVFSSLDAILFYVSRCTS